LTISDSVSVSSKEGTMSLLEVAGQVCPLADFAIKFVDLFVGKPVVNLPVVRHIGYLRGSNFDRNVWYPIREAAGIPDTFVFHDLRHIQASLLLAAGVDLKVIQKRLGHRDFATTANTYSHLLQNAQNEAVDKLSAMMIKTAPEPNNE